MAIDNENFHSIVGREKDLIITAGGENIAPQPIHDLVKEQLPVISQVLLLGDNMGVILGSAVGELRILSYLSKSVVLSRLVY